MGNEDITSLIEAGKFAEAQLAIGTARRELKLSGAEARALGKMLDEAKEAAPAPVAAGRRKQ